MKKESGVGVSRLAVLLTAGGLVFSTLVGTASVAGAATPTWNVVTGGGTANEGSSNAMSAVDCHVPTFCLAVGTAEPSNSNNETNLVELWNGNRWVNTAGTGGTTTYSKLSCPSTTRCYAIAQFADPYVTGYGIVSWNGHEWRTALGSNSRLSAASAISCASADRCVAVGERVTEIWNGEKWSKGAPLQDGSIAISCPTSTMCMSVSSVPSGYRTTEPTSDVWNGSLWHTVPVSAPRGIEGFGLADVSCPSAKWCVAVGDTTVGDEDDQTLIEYWNGQEWHVMVSPSPGITTGHLGANGGPAIGLGAVACPTETSCEAVGYESPTDSALSEGRPQALIEQYDGSSWLVSPSEQGVDGILYSVSCAAPRRCAAVGEGYPDSETGTPIYEVTTGLNR
jgi:hypothetical protein